MVRGRREVAFLICVAASSVLAVSAKGQTVINGASLAMQSSGSASGNAWTLDSDGYVGTYITLSSPTAVTLTANAASGKASAPAADLTFAIANDTYSAAVSSTTAANVTYTTPVLPAGTYFVRTQLDNSTAPSSTLASATSASSSLPSLKVNSLSVSGTGVSVLNQNTSANALAAANTYADNFRSGAGTVHLQLPGGQSIGAGTAAHVQLASNAFNFALAVQGQSAFYQPPTWLNYNTSTGQYYAPTPGSAQALYQQHLVQNFNMIVPANAGKWQNDEYTQNQPTMQIVDAMSQFAAANGLGMRMHNLIWWNQQPSYVTNLFGTTSNNPPSAANLAAIQNAVSNRINYYVSGIDPGLNAPRADSYAEMDVLNEPVHSDLNSVTDTYTYNSSTNTYSVSSYNNNHYNAYLGASGVASIYSQVAAAVQAAGANTRLYTNEYNVLQSSSNPYTNANDPYANWYLNYVTQLNSAGFGKVVTGVGSELYATYNSSNYTTGSLSAATMMQGLENLAVAGDPITLSEFSDNYGYGSTPTPQAFANDLVTALTMMYGNPNATTFGFWGGLGGSDANPITSLYDANWNLTAVGLAYQQWMQQWETNLDLITDANGDLNFTGTYGTYDLTLDGQEYQFTLAPGDSTVDLTVVPEPASLGVMVTTVAALFVRRRHRSAVAS